MLEESVSLAGRVEQTSCAVSMGYIDTAPVEIGFDTWSGVPLLVYMSLSKDLW